MHSSYECLFSGLPKFVSCQLELIASWPNVVHDQLQGCMLLECNTATLLQLETIWHPDSHTLTNTRRWYTPCPVLLWRVHVHRCFNKQLIQRTKGRVCFAAGHMMHVVSWPRTCTARVEHAVLHHVETTDAAKILHFNAFHFIATT